MHEQTQPALAGQVDRHVRPLRHEAARLEFLERRDGLDGAQDFARRTLVIYRAAVKRGKDGRRSGYGSAYRRALVESCLDFRLYLRPNAGNEATETAPPAQPERLRVNRR